MIVLINGRLTQWDTGRKISIILENGDSVDEVHYYYEGESEGYKVGVTAEGDTFIADIPNILLQENKTIEVCTVASTEDGIRTLETKSYRVYARQKPPNYIYTETELITVQKLVDDALERAKESGEFKGDPYVLTEFDKTSIVNAVLSALPDYREVEH